MTVLRRREERRIQGTLPEYTGLHTTLGYTLLYTLRVHPPSSSLSRVHAAVQQRDGQQALAQGVTELSFYANGSYHAVSRPETGDTLSTILTKMPGPGLSF